MITIENLKEQIAQAYDEQNKRRERIMDGMDQSDCFLSQQLNIVEIKLLKKQLEILENDGFYEFPALFDLDGNCVSEKIITTRYGKCFVIESTPTLSAKFVDPFVKPSTLERKGYRLGTVSRKAWAIMKGFDVVVFPTDKQEG